MKRLLIVTTIPITLSGFLLPFVYHFRAKGWQVDGMAQGISTDVKCLEALDQTWDINWSRNPLDPHNLLTVPSKIRAIVIQESYDLVHVHTPVAAFVTRYALRNLSSQQKPKIIYTAHGFHFYRDGNPLKNAVFLQLEKLAGQWTDYLVVINNEDQETVKQFRIVPATQVRYMPGIGVDRTQYNLDTIAPTEIARIRQELGLQPDTPLLLAIAEFTPRKRHRDLLKAFAQITHPTAHLALAGTGALLEKMMQLTLKLGLHNRVHFLGFRSDIPALIRTSAATVLVSEQEGLPRSVMESMSLETPVIGTNIRGTRDLLTEGCGVLVNVGDVKRLANAIDWLLAHPEEAYLIGKRGHDRMENYDLKHILNLHETLYAEALREQAVALV